MHSDYEIRIKEPADKWAAEKAAFEEGAVIEKRRFTNGAWEEWRVSEHPNWDDSKAEFRNGMNAEQIDAMLSDLLKELDYDIWKDFYRGASDDPESTEETKAKLQSIAAEHIKKAIS